MAINTTSSMSSNVYNLFFDKVLLDRLTKTLVLEPLATKSLNIPRGMGTQAKWLRYAERHVSAASSFLLSQGVIPADSSITTNNITASVSEYGNYAVVTDVLDFAAVDFLMENRSILENVMGVLGDEAAELIDVIIRTELEGTLPIQYCNGKGSLATTGVNDVMSVKEGLKAKVTLRKNSVKPHESGAFVCVVHPAGIGDIQNDTNVGSWVDINKYVGMAPMNGELGRAYGVRYLESDNISSTTSGTLSSATVYSNIFLGRGCFGTVALGDGNVSTYVKRSGDNSTNDPLNQIATCGYKLLGYVAKYLGGSGNGTNDRGTLIKGGSGF